MTGTELGLKFGGWLDFAAGRTELFFTAVFGFVTVLVLLYSIARIRGSFGQVAEYYVFVLLLAAAGLGMVYARNLLLMFVCWEVATVAVWRLVAYYRREQDAAAGAWALYVNFAAAAVMLIGFVLLLVESGSLCLGDLVGDQLPLVPASLILVGILAKSATLPLYVWLPKAYDSAPAPVCALLSGIAENLGVVLFLKLFVLTVGLPAGFALFCGGLAVLSSLIAGGVALRATTMRGVLAYSTISQLGFILLGVAMAGRSGLIGALLYVMAHAVAKTGLFLGAGAVEDSAGTGELKELGGIARSAPALAGAFAVLSLSVMGMPPLAGFFAKVGVILAATRQSMVLGAGSVVAALFTVLYLSRLYMRVFLGQSAVPAGATKPLSRFVTALVVVAALVSVAGGVLWFAPAWFVEPGLSVGGLL
uniref:NADH dehydrogenase n=1 Tax=candidate division WOR-3 bacterium TaxID=2052148 RepID=A0A7C4CC80_UNCW3